MNKNNRITYRFDHATAKTAKAGEEQQPGSGSLLDSKPKKETDKKSKVVPLYSHTDSFGLTELAPWNSPFQDDVGALERLIRDTDERKPEEKADEEYKQTPAAAGDREIDEPRRPQAAEWTWDIPAEPTAGAGRKKTVQAEAGNTIMRKPQPNNNYDPRQEEEEPAVPVEPIAWDDAGEVAERKAAYTTRYYRPTSSPSWMKVILTVAGALATGAVFGYLLLSLFTGTPAWNNGNDGDTGGDALPAGGAVTQEPGSGKQGGEETGVKGAAVPPNTSGKTASVDVPEQTYYMLQYGVFGSSEGRDAALAELSAKGMARAALSSEEDFRVYAGISTDRDAANTLKQQFDGNVELYVKTVDVPSLTSFPFEGKASDLQTFLTETNAFIQMLSDLSFVQLEQQAPSPFSDNASAAWKEAEQRWAQSAAAAQTGFADEASQAAFTQLTASIRTAAGAFADYEKKPSRAHLWAAQSALMEAVMTQKNWFANIIAL